MGWRRVGRGFLDAHSTSPICVPSRYSLLTGEYYWRVGKTRGRFFPRDRQLLIDPAKVTLGSLMKKAGYRTAFIGKWHLGFGAAGPDWNHRLAPGPTDLGFDYFFGLPGTHSEKPLVFVGGGTGLSASTRRTRFENL